MHDDIKKKKSHKHISPPNSHHCNAFSEFDFEIYFVIPIVLIILISHYCHCVGCSKGEMQDLVAAVTFIYKRTKMHNTLEKQVNNKDKANHCDINENGQRTTKTKGYIN